jgi:NAD(P)H-dependent flavin oxidoreductase YrpB (nitropropane dioxygenase family)
MNNEICRMTGAEFPLFAFSHCRDVVAAVSRAGGFGVLGGSGFTPDSLQVELDWIDAHVDGKPYGIDILIPENMGASSELSDEQIAKLIPDQHVEFTIRLLEKYGVKLDRSSAVRTERPTVMPDIGEQLLDVAFQHPIRLVANALGVAPQSMIDRARMAGIPCAALVGAKEHALRQVAAGVDIIVAQGTEAGGHCGDVTTLVLVPEVIRAIKDVRPVPVLAAGGIMTGQQMAGAMAMGAQGAWTGSVWLASTESEAAQSFREKMVEATSRDTIRSKARTGKPSRQLRSAWHDAWEGPDSPGSLPLPLMPMISQPALTAVDRAADAGSQQARELVTYFVGQGVGLIDGIYSAGSIVQRFKEEFAEAIGDLLQTIEE